jgi:release factor glutamine methyltransferase
MNKTELLQSLRNRLTGTLHLLEDKPEETVDSTIRSLWLYATGYKVSAEGSLNIALPDLSEEQIEKLDQLIDLRLKGSPLAHLTNRQNFMGIEMISDKRALIPRKETEILGKNALDISLELSQKKNSQIKVIDVCCGSGNLGIAIAYFNENCKVYSADLSDEAVLLARENVDFLNLNDRIQVRQSDLLDSFENDEFYGITDLIICNPPYISSSKVLKMDSEISANEPALAFDGGMLGIKIIQKLITEAPKYLTVNGWLIFEVGAGQGEFISQICDRTGAYSKLNQFRDSSGIIRVISVQKA